MLLRYDNVRQRADLVRTGGPYVSDPGLESAVTISLFSDAQTTPEDTDKGTARRGWWADAFATDKIGSRLWRACRKGGAAGLLLAQTAAVESLQWMVNDGVASAVTATTSRSRNGWILLGVTIERPGAGPWSLFWEVPFAV